MRRFEIVYTGLHSAQVIQGCVFDNGEVAWVRHDRRERGQGSLYESDALLIIDCVPSGQMTPYPDLEWIDPE